LRAVVLHQSTSQSSHSRAARVSSIRSVRDNLYRILTDIDSIATICKEA
jgi:hypothetical protein